MMPGGAFKVEAANEAYAVDLDLTAIRDLNQRLHDLNKHGDLCGWRVLNPRGQHAIAAGLDAPVSVDVEGPAGYYCAGMNKLATVRVHGSAGTGVAENMMSGFVHVQGDASQSAGASAHGGLLLIDGNASARCGISLKGADIIVKGSVGHLSAFMAQAGSLIVFGNAGESLGDSIYEARLFVRGEVAGLGADCVEKEMTDEARRHLFSKLEMAALDHQADISDFRCYGSARKLYHFHVDHAGDY